MIVRLPRAEDDTWSAWSYIAVHNEAAADRFLDRITGKLRQLEEFPFLGPARHDWGDGLRTVNVGAYLLVYRPMDGGIELVRVLHGARDLGAISFD